MKTYCFFLFACLSGFLLVQAEMQLPSSKTNFQVEYGKEAKYNFGSGMFLIKRITPASPKPQYLFANSNQDGTWTTDGRDKIASTAYLHWNGTMTFKKIEKNDIGEYSMPLEPSRLPLAQTVVVFRGLLILATHNKAN